MIPKKPAPDLIRGGCRFSEKIMLHQQARAGWRFEDKVITLKAGGHYLGPGNIRASERLSVRSRDCDPYEGMVLAITFERL
jgi:hypothetical protein